jgi:hypothetical protein
MGKRRIIDPRPRLFVAVEGEGEHQFVLWLKKLCEGRGLNLAFDPYGLSGGDPLAMLSASVDRRRFGVEKGAYARSCLIVDQDRLTVPIDVFRRRVADAGFTLVLQRPSFEGVLLRLHAGEEASRFEASKQIIEARLRQKWPDIWDGNRKGLIFKDQFAARFTLADLHRAAAHDPDLRALLEFVRLWPPP